MEWFIAVLAVVALGVAAVVASGGMGQMDIDPVRDTYAAALPEHALSAADVRDVRLGVTLRGYAMSQVDDLLDRLAGEIEARDARIAELTKEGPQDVVDEAAGWTRAETSDSGELLTASASATGVDQERERDTVARRAWVSTDGDTATQPVAPAYAEPESRG